MWVVLNYTLFTTFLTTFSLTKARVKYWYFFKTILLLCQQLNLADHAGWVPEVWANLNLGQFLKLILAKKLEDEIWQFLSKVKNIHWPCIPYVKTTCIKENSTQHNSLSQEAFANVVLKVDIPSLTRKYFRYVLLHTPAHLVRLQVHRKHRWQKMFP